MRLMIKCVYEMGSDESVRNVMRNYSDRFSSTMSRCLNTKMNPKMYEELAYIRDKVLDEDATVINLLECLIDKIPNENIRYLIDTAPVFDLAPNNLKAYILVCLGVTSELFASRSIVA